MKGTVSAPPPENQPCDCGECPACARASRLKAERIGKLYHGKEYHLEGVDRPDRVAELRELG